MTPMPLRFPNNSPDRGKGREGKKEGKERRRPARPNSSADTRFLNRIKEKFAPPLIFGPGEREKKKKGKKKGGKSTTNIPAIQFFHLVSAMGQGEKGEYWPCFVRKGKEGGFFYPPPFFFEGARRRSSAGVGVGGERGGKKKKKPPHQNQSQQRGSTPN